MSKEQFMEWTKSVWTRNSESAKKVGHPAPFPLEVPARLSQLYAFTGDVVLDAFMGSGTVSDHHPHDSRLSRRWPDPTAPDRDESPGMILSE